VLGLLLNEVARAAFKRTIQTIVYMPHFLSWITVFGITFLFLSGDGVINQGVRASGLAPIQFLQEPNYFLPLIVSQQVWHDAGWGAIIILAALTRLNPELYEAAMLDGADRWQRLVHVTLPGIKDIVLVLLILRLGTILRTGFEQLYVMQNPLNYGASDVLETYAFRLGLQNNQLSYATAVGLFQSISAILLVLFANRVVKRLGGEGIW
jgi:putative aldouronate transport system permease protein